MAHLNASPRRLIAPRPVMPLDAARAAPVLTRRLPPGADRSWAFGPGDTIAPGRRVVRRLGDGGIHGRTSSRTARRGTPSRSSRARRLCTTSIAWCPCATRAARCAASPPQGCRDISTPCSRTPIRICCSSTSRARRCAPQPPAHCRRRSSRASGSPWRSRLTPSRARAGSISTSSRPTSSSTPARACSTSSWPSRRPPPRACKSRPGPGSTCRPSSALPAGRRAAGGPGGRRLRTRRLARRGAHRAATVPSRAVGAPGGAPRGRARRRAGVFTRRPADLRRAGRRAQRAGRARRTPCGVARTVASRPPTAAARPSSLCGMRNFITRSPDPPAARPHDVEEAVRERLYGGRRRLDVRPRHRPRPVPPLPEPRHAETRA